MLPVHLDERGRRARRGPRRSRAGRRSAGDALAVGRHGPCEERRSPSSAQLSTTRRRGASNRAWTRAAPAPSRTSEADARAPSASARPTVIMVLPAPVSPVRTFRPGCSARSRSSMTPSPVMWSSRSTRASYPAAPTSRRRGRRGLAVASPGSPNLSRTSDEEPGRVVAADEPGRAARARGSARWSRPAARCSRARRRTGRRSRRPSPRADHLARGAQHERAVEHHVRGDRREHEGIHRRAHDRPPRRERVGGGTRSGSPRSRRRPRTSSRRRRRPPPPAGPTGGVPASRP